MTFERYMRLCLYHPDYGYYAQGQERTGVAGDYFTSPDLHPIFARLIARQAAEMWAALGCPRPFRWVEMGAGRGLFACDFLRQAQRLDFDFFNALNYIVIEPSPRARSQLRARLLGEALGANLELCASLDDIQPSVGCFFSNELLDAFPVAVVTRVGGELAEIYVGVKGNELCEQLGPVSNPAISAAVLRYARDIKDGQRVEVSLDAMQWIRSVALKLARGFVLTIDYGDLAERLYTPDRPKGTLMAYRRHLALEDFFSRPGEQDLTAHVNFSALIDVGREAGLALTGFTTQERFLMALGEAQQFAELYEAGQSDIERFQARLKLKRLLHPMGMGETFKVLIQHRDVAVSTLTGLKLAHPE